MMEQSATKHRLFDQWCPHARQQIEPDNPAGTLAAASKDDRMNRPLAAEFDNQNRAVNRQRQKRHAGEVAQDSAKCFTKNPPARMPSQPLPQLAPTDPSQNRPDAGE